MTDQQHCQPAGPGEHHKKLEPFAGKFKSVVKLWMGPGDPMVSTGVMVSSWDLGGRFLHQVYTGDPSEGPFPNFEGRGYWGFNAVTGKYEGFWIDNASTMMQTETGELSADGKTWTMLGEMDDPSGSGGKMVKRSVIKLIDNNRNSLEMFFRGPDGNEFKAMEIQYERA